MCSLSPQTHHHFLKECSFTKKITKEIESKLGSPIFRDEVLEKSNWSSNRTSFWLSSWLISYTWNSLARINLDEDFSETIAINLAPYVFRRNILIYNQTFLHINYLKSTKENLRLF